MLSNARFVVRSTMSVLVHKSMQDHASCFSLEEHLLACMFADGQDQDQETGT